MFAAWELQLIIDALDNIINNYAPDKNLAEVEQLTRGYRGGIPELDMFSVWLDKGSAEGYKKVRDYAETQSLLFDARQHFKDLYTRDYSHLGLWEQGN